MALIVLLVVALFVAIVGVAITDNVVADLRAATSQSDAVKARYLAEAGIADAANHLSVDNTWTGPITQTLGSGSYTVKVDTATSQTGPRGAVKSVVSTGTVFGAAPSGATQTVRETFLVLPQAFSKAVMSSTVFFINTQNDTPVVKNTVLRQLGTIHANNQSGGAGGQDLGNHPVNIENNAITVIGQITSGGTQSDIIAGTCIACNPQTGQPNIPFPTFDFSHYRTLAQTNTNPCPGANLSGQTGTYFTTQGAFDNCVNALTVDSSGFRTLSGIVFVEIAGTSPGSVVLQLPNNTAEAKLKILGTLIVYQDTGGGTCVPATPCGDLNFKQVGTWIFQAQNGEPALMVGGGLTNSQNNSTITITGLVYIMDNIITPSNSTNLRSNDYTMQGSGVTIRGMLVANRVDTFTSGSLIYDPSSFFPGLPSGLISPGPPFVLLPISWSSGK